MQVRYPVQTNDSIESKEPGYDEDKDRLEEKKEETGDEETINQVF